MTKKADGDKMDESIADDVKMESTTETDSFPVESIPVLYSLTSDMYNQPPSARKPQHKILCSKPLTFAVVVLARKPYRISSITSVTVTYQ